MPPIITKKNHRSASVFTPEALLREARRQKQLPKVPVPAICILDPDGDIVRRLRKSGLAKPFDAWPCYHTALHCFEFEGAAVGLIGSAVGASFAVLVAEELFASGCELLLSLTSAGQIQALGKPPYFVVIDRALRDEGTSYHYAEPTEFAEAESMLITMASEALATANVAVFVGASWTTDAPFRETAEAIEWARSRGAVAVEMEAAALYTFATARGVRVLCLAHVTNTMAQSGDDFEKGTADGTDDALIVLSGIIRGYRAIATSIDRPAVKA